MGNNHYELTEEQWNRIKDLIPQSRMGRPRKDDRLILNAMLWLARSEAGWQNLPERYGSWKTVYSRFCKWRDDGTFLHIFEVLTHDSDMENLSLDSTVIKAHPHSSGAKKGLYIANITNLLEPAAEERQPRFMLL